MERQAAATGEARNKTLLDLNARQGPAEEVILLVGHGSRDQQGVEEFRQFSQIFGQMLPGRTVNCCFLELAEPPILEEIERCVSQGARRIKLVPFFLMAAGHVKNDVASAVNLARLRYPAVEFQYGAPIGVQSLILEILAERLEEADRANPSRLTPAETAVLLIERGSSDPDANSEVYKAARMLWEGRNFGWVETAFIGITTPRVPEGIDRCVRLGARRIILLPYFLFTGVLVKRIYDIAQQKQQEYQELEIVSASHIGVDPRLAQIALGQLEQLEAGQVRMSCDLCKYRVRLSGFEDAFEAPQFSDHAHGLRGEHSHEHISQLPHQHDHPHNGHREPPHSHKREG